MNINQKETLKFCLKGKMVKLSLNLIFARGLNLIFLMYCVSAFYLLIFDTSFIVSIGLYENKYIAAAVCFFAVIIGVVLFVLSQWYSFKCKIKTYFVIDNVSFPEFSLNLTLKRFLLKFIVLFMQSVIIILSFLPSIIISLFALNLLNDGVSAYIFAILLACDVILFVSSVLFSSCIIQKYSLCDYCLAENKDMSIKAIIKLSKYLMDGKCAEIGKYKLSRFAVNLFGLIIPMLTVRVTAAQFLISTDKIIPHAHRRAHTEKPVVFYFGRKATAE